MLRTVSLLTLLALGGCGAAVKDLGNAGKMPALSFCAGKGTVSATGSALMYGATGSIMFDCGSGAYFGQGFPAASLPIMPNAAAPQIQSFPPLGPPPATPAAPTAPITTQ